MNYLFYDYETSGRSKPYDQIYQFGAIKTDENFNEIGEPVEYFCKPRLDVIPSPYAVKVNRLNLDELDAKGLSEFEFAKSVSHVLHGDGDQCVVGYNSKAFDNIFTRFLFYRNFLDPYSWTYSNRNSTFDLFDLACLGYSLDRIPGIVTADESGPSLRLEKLSAWNGFEHENAHDAISDVRATIQLARMLKAENPKMFDFALSLRDRGRVRRIIESNETFLHGSSFNGYDNNFLSLNAYVSKHPMLPNSVIAWNLRHDPREILGLSPDKIREQMYQKAAEREFEVGFDEFKANQAPMITPFSESAKDRLSNYEGCIENKRILDENRAELAEIAAVVFDSAISEIDPDEDLYAGEYFGERDANRQLIVELLKDPVGFDTKKFSCLRFQRQHMRLKARNFPESLSENDRTKFESFLEKKLRQTDPAGWTTLEQFEIELAELRSSGTLTDDDVACLSLLEVFVHSRYEQIK